MQSHSDYKSDFSAEYMHGKNELLRPLFLAVIMVLMTQVGYTENMDFSIGLDPETESKDTGSSTSALTPSVEGADLIIDEAIDDQVRTFHAWSQSRRRATRVLRFCLWV